MSRCVQRVLLLCMCMFACVSAGPGVAAERVISIYVPPFEGPPGLSRSVNTILRLQIWQTLRTAAPGDDAGVSFGSGTVRWGPARLPALTHASAETLAHHGRITAQLVLWGTVQEYGNGAVMQAFLSIPFYKRLNDRYYEDFRTERSEVWTVRIPVDGELIEFRQDIPRRRLAFEPIILTSDVIGHYSDLDAIVMYAPDDPGRRIGTVGDVIDAVEQHGDRALVRSGGLTGIVPLPELSKHRSEVVDFASGLIRIFRRDWAGARDLLARVVENHRAPTDIRIDAHLYRAMANARLGRSGIEDINQAQALNPYAARVIRFAIMDKLAQLGRVIERGASQDERNEIIAAIERVVSDGKHLFLREDPWLKNLSAGLARIEQTR